MVLNLMEYTYMNVVIGEACVVRPEEDDVLFRCSNNHGICAACVKRQMKTNVEFSGFMKKKYGKRLNNVDCWDGKNEIPIRFCDACKYNVLFECQYKDLVSDICKKYDIDFDKEKQIFLSKHYKTRGDIDDEYDIYCDEVKVKEAEKSAIKKE